VICTSGKHSNPPVLRQFPGYPYFYRMRTSFLIPVCGILFLVCSNACSQNQTPDRESDKPLQSTVTSEPPVDFPEWISLEKTLEEGKKANKNCLIYFSGWNSVNSRKLEDQVLNREDIQQRIKEHFVCAVAYIDDRRKEPGQAETKGERYARMQQELFNSIGAPMLYILSPDRKVVAAWSYAQGVESFNDFLESGM
jgi:thiol:disulfide interchange protein DsbD